MSDLVVQENTKPVQFFDLTPQAKVDYAANVADVLTSVIEKQKLYVSIQGRKYIKAEGWATLGAMLNVLPKEEKVIETADGSFEATVNLVSTNTGIVVGGASAYCGIDEKRWGGADKYARRSMAITRATGKAYRLAFAFIPAMAGYATTPAEEMPHEEKRTWEAQEETTTRTTIQEPIKVQASAPQTSRVQSSFGGPSEKQLKRLFAIMKQAGYEDYEVDEFIANTYRISSKTQLSRVQYDTVCNMLETRTLPRPNKTGAVIDELKNSNANGEVEIPF